MHRFRNHFLYIRIVFLFFLGISPYGCGLVEIETDIASIQIEGLQLLERDEVLSYLGLDPKNANEKSAGDSYKSWKQILLDHPRIEKANVQKRRAIVKIEITEKQGVGIIQSENDLYELDENFSIISKNDVRMTWSPVFSGDFKITGKNVEGSVFYSIWKQSKRLKQDFPDLWKRISEVEVSRDGDIFIYMHYPNRLSVNMGSFISAKQARKLYSSIAFLESESRKAVFLDLRGEDAFYY